MSTLRSNIKCAHTACETNSSEKDQASFFCFPKNEHLRLQWLEQMDGMDLAVLNHRKLFNRGWRVCSRHFDDHQFQTEEKKKLNFQQIPCSVLAGIAETSTAKRGKFAEDNEGVWFHYMETEEIEPVVAEPKIHSQVLSSSATWTTIPATESLITSQAVPSCSTWTSETDAETTINPETPRKGSSRRITLHELGVNRVKDLTPRKKRLFAKLQRKEKILSVYRKRGRVLSSQFKKSSIDILSPNSRHFQNIQQLPRALRVFVFSLLKNFNKNKTGRRYSLEEKSLFLSIYKHGPRCYRFLQKILSLPAIRTLRRSLVKFEVNTGINEKLFEYLNKISENMEVLHRHCTLIFDEMEISKNLRLDWKVSWT